MDLFLGFDFTPEEKTIIIPVELHEDYSHLNFYISIAAAAGIAETATSKFLEYNLYQYNDPIITTSLNRVSVTQSNLPEIEVTKLDDVRT